MFFQENTTVPNRLVVKMDGAFGSGVYKCEITIETPVFLTLDISKNITVIGQLDAVTIDYFIEIEIVTTIVVFKS